MSDYRTWLEERVAATEREETGTRQAEMRWSWMRLGIFVAGVLLVAGGVALSASVAAAALVIALLAFIATLRRHQRALHEHDLARRRLVAMRESLRREGGAIAVVRSTLRPDDPAITVESTGALEHGRRWELSGQERDDLDLYAQPAGLFGLLNRTSTSIGAARLRDWLERPSLEPATIAARQSAGQWLRDHDAARIDLAAALVPARGQDRSMQAFDEAVRMTRQYLATPVLWVLCAWSAACVLLAAVAIYQAVAGDLRWVTAVSVVALLNCAMLAGLWSRVRRQLQQWEAALDFAAAYQEVATQAAATLPADVAPLSELRQVLANVARPDALPAAVRWANWSAGGGWIYLMLNILALWDLHMHAGIARHVVPHRQAMLGGLDALAQLEAVLSLACFAREPGTATMPRIEPAGSPTRAPVGLLSIEGATHPLIEPGRVVSNDITLELGPGRNLWLITGSNMSGKSTFLRAVGVCALLAQVGGAVPARSMRMGLMRLVTDLRVRDDIGRGESYFLAEVRQLKRMIAAETSEPIPVLGLVDEPFRGTNHQEQHAATLAIVEHLQRAPGLFLLATHDRELARAAEAGGVANFHFREDLHDGQLVFDYRLRPGVARTRNAIRVLEREGYPPELVARAHAIVGTSPEMD